MFAFAVLSYFESVLLISLIIMFLLNYFQKILFKTTDYSIFRNQVAMIVISVLFMSFTINNDTINQNYLSDINNSKMDLIEANEEIDNYAKYTNDLSIGVKKGNYSGICGPTYDYTYYNIDYEGNFNFDGRNNVYYKLGGFSSSAYSLTSTKHREYSHMGSRHILGYSNYKFKIGIGFQGVFSSEENSEIVFRSNNYSIFPVAELRAGEKYFFDANVGSFFHPEVGSTVRAGWGYRFNNMSNITIGVDIPAGIYFNGMFFIGDYVYVSPYFSAFDKKNYFFGGKFGFRFASPEY